MRRRMEREGWDALKPYEMLELVLYHAVPRQDVSDVARLLVDRFGSVGGVFGASREQLMAVEGMTPSLAEWLCLTGELMRAYLDLHNQSDLRLSCYQEVQAFLLSRPAANSCAWALYADFDFNFITYTELRGDKPWWDPANARRMLVEAVGNGARYVYLVLWTDRARLDLDDREDAALESIAHTLRAADLDLVDCVLARGRDIASMNVSGNMKAIRAESGCMALHERYAGSPSQNLDKL